MPVPTYDQFIEPILRYLAARPDGAPARDVYEGASEALGLDEAQWQEILPSGGQAVYKNRVGWAHDRLKRAGLSFSARRGLWRLTPQGFSFSSQHQTPLPPDVIEELATAKTDVRLTPEEAEQPDVAVPNAGPAMPTASPDDRLEGALAELRQTARAELLETLAQVSPTFFETIVLDLLHRMGYGVSRADLQRVGGSGDRGIDGVISLDRLGLEKVYVQAKRRQNVVGRPDVQAFYGALAGQRAKKGVFITTSSTYP